MPARTHSTVSFERSLPILVRILVTLPTSSLLHQMRNLLHTQTLSHTLSSHSLSVSLTCKDGWQGCKQRPGPVSLTCKDGWQGCIQRPARFYRGMNLLVRDYRSSSTGRLPAQGRRPEQAQDCMHRRRQPRRGWLWRLSVSLPLADRPSPAPVKPMSALSFALSRQLHIENQTGTTEMQSCSPEIIQEHPACSFKCKSHMWSKVHSKKQSASGLGIS